MDGARAFGLTLWTERDGTGRSDVHDPTYLGCLNHLVNYLLSLLDLLGGHGSLGSEIKPKAVRCNQGASLVSFPKHGAQGEVQNVGSCMVAHDRSTSGL